MHVCLFLFYNYTNISKTEMNTGNVNREAKTKTKRTFYSVQNDQCCPVPKTLTCICILRMTLLS